MLKILKNKVSPIGLDLGSASLKMIQLEQVDGGIVLVAASEVEVPQELQEDPGHLQTWYIDSIKEQLSLKPYKGKKAISCLPTRDLLIQHLRLAKMDDKQLTQALPWEAQDKVPFDIQQAHLRHIVAGEVYEQNEVRLEVILMASSRRSVLRHLNIIKQAKLEIESINVEPCALMNGLTQPAGRNDESAPATVFLDLGLSSSKVVISHDRGVVFCRTINIGGKHIRQNLCKLLAIDYREAEKIHHNLEKLSLIKSGSPENFAGQNAAIKLSQGKGEAITVMDNKLPSVSAEVDMETIVSRALQQLLEEIRGCIRYHDLMFYNQPVKKAIFLGGQAKNKKLSRSLAQELGLPAQVADPLARISGPSRFGPHSDLVEGQIHPQWAVAYGLCLNN